MEWQHDTRFISSQVATDTSAEMELFANKIIGDLHILVYKSELKEPVYDDWYGPPLF